jgi:hypothetical protein
MQAARRTSLERRQFLRAIGIGAALTAASPLGMEVRADSESNDEKRKPRYKESAHVKAYYRVNRYPK